MADYVRNKDLYEELIICKTNGKLSIKAITMFTLIANKLSTKMSYYNEDDRKDCIQGAIIECYLYWDRFDASISNNPFSYFTQVIKNGFAKQWRVLHQDQSAKSKVRLSDNIWSL